MKTKLNTIEKHGAPVFTRNMFLFFYKEIELEGLLFVVQRLLQTDNHIYFMGKYSASELES